MQWRTPRLVILLAVLVAVTTSACRSGTADDRPHVGVSPETTVFADGIDITFHLEFTENATVIHYQLPGDVLELGLPRVGIAPDRLSETTSAGGSAGDTERVAAGPPTPTGSELTVSFGPFISLDGEAVAEIVNIAAALDRAGVRAVSNEPGSQREWFPLASEDQIEGETRLVRRALIVHDTRDYAQASYMLRVQVPATLHPRRARIAIWNSDGRELISSGGGRGPDTTNAEVWYDDPRDLSRLAVIIGPGAQVHHGPWQATVTAE